MKGTTTGWRIVVDADSVGLTYKDALRAELEKDPRVDSAIDVGIHAGEGVVALTDPPTTPKLGSNASGHRSATGTAGTAGHR